MKRLITAYPEYVNAAKSLDAVINHISDQLNGTGQTKYSVTPDPDNRGLVLVMNLNTGKKKLIKVGHTKKPGKGKNYIPWSSDFHVNSYGEVYDGEGNLVGRAKVWPAESNTTRYREDYLFEGEYDHNIADMRKLDKSEDGWEDFKQTLE